MPAAVTLPLLPAALAPVPASNGLISRRLLSISWALQLSGAPPLHARQRLLLARYVAGWVALSDILPALEVPR